MSYTQEFDRWWINRKQFHPKNKKQYSILKKWCREAFISGVVSGKHNLIYKEADEKTPLQRVDRGVMLTHPVLVKKNIGSVGSDNPDCNPKSCDLSSPEKD